MIRLLATALAVIATGPASALSCAAPSVVQAYRYADESPVNYAIAVGSLTASGPSNPPGGAVPINGDLNEMAGYVQPAFFVGNFFDGSGFNLARQVNVTVEVSCLGPWCGGFEDVGYGLIFLRRNDDGSYVLEAGPCPGEVFANPTQTQIQQVITCYNSGC